LADLTVALSYQTSANFNDCLRWLSSEPSVSGILVARSRANPNDLTNPVADLAPAHVVVDADLTSGLGLASVLRETHTPYLLLLAGPVQFTGQTKHYSGLSRLLNVASDSGAGLVFSDYFDATPEGVKYHPLIDYQLGGVRDIFDFGPAILLSMDACREALATRGPISADLRWAALYDLRLKVSTVSGIIRIPEPLYSVGPASRGAGVEGLFDYVDPKRRDYQLEMERVLTDHLKSIGAHLEPNFAELPEDVTAFPVEASIIIPVRNRRSTIGQAVTSALSQQTSFEFNVIVVDNHSTDGTTDVLREMSAQDPRLIHIIPAANDLGIGGCWNVAVYSADCGRIAVQLDSDDLYKDGHTLETVINKFKEAPYAMVIGSYQITNFDLQEIPPGLIDHREWTRENGRNNALRINGLGAPRAFYVPVLRQTGLPNTSYGEDYAIALRLSRDYEIGRIFESLYFARRWEGNSDAKLDLQTANRYDTYKDRLRSLEIAARQRKNRK